MKKLRNVGIALAMGAVAAIPLGGNLAGAQDAGDCGTSGVAASAQSQNLGGLLGAVAPVVTQLVAPVNLPVTSPNAQSCNTNSNSIGSPSGGGSGPIVVVPATAVGGAPRFTG
jgi:hypothetical protein